MSTVGGDGDSLLVFHTPREGAALGEILALPPSLPHIGSAGRGHPKLALWVGGKWEWEEEEEEEESRAAAAEC